VPEHFRDVRIWECLLLQSAHRRQCKSPLSNKMWNVLGAQVPGQQSQIITPDAGMLNDTNSAELSPASGPARLVLYPGARRTGQGRGCVRIPMFPTFAAVPMEIFFPTLPCAPSVADRRQQFTVVGNEHPMLEF
jgi:hypothetical protein